MTSCLRGRRLTVCRRHEKVVCKSGSSSNAESSQKVELVIFEAPKELQIFVKKEVTRVRWDAAQGHDVCAMPEAKQSLFLVENFA